MLLCVALATVLVAGCATPPPASDKEAVASFHKDNDPYEPFNRAMFDFNLFLDDVILRPVSYLYKEGVPEPIQYNIHSFLNNLRGPVILANDLMQGEMDRAGTTLLRFGMNTTVGLLGIIDFATEAGIPAHDEDFGQTLAVWNTDSGPYLVLPIFGPSNPRDAAGLVVDTLIDPLTWIASTEFAIGRAATTAVDRRARRYDAIDDLQKNSLDFYSAVKSLYRQRRMDEIRNGVPTAVSPAPGRISVAPDGTGKDQQSQDQTSGN
jgi:phospholipid-binding lipoprotein MlaA